MIKTCELCGAQYIAKRSTSRFCSTTCRTRNYKGMGAFAGQLTPPRQMIILDNEDVEAIISNAHDSASDLSRASSMTRPPLSESLHRVALDLEQSLRRENL